MSGNAMHSNAQSRPIVVGIGASAGGVKALGTLLENLPPDAGAAFVVIVHLDPNAQSELPKILAAHTRMPVLQVSARLPLESNHVYVIAPDRQLEITDNEIAAAPLPRRAAIAPPSTVSSARSPASMETALP